MAGEGVETGEAFTGCGTELLGANKTAEEAQRLLAKELERDDEGNGERDTAKCLAWREGVREATLSTSQSDKPCTHRFRYQLVDLHAKISAQVWVRSLK